MREVMVKYKYLTVFILVLTLIAVGMVAFAEMSYAKDVSVTFAWDADNSPVTDTRWDEVRLFERTGSTTYDYTTPAGNIPQSYDASDNSTPTTYTHSTTVPDGVLTELYWVVRASAGELESADSEEVNMTVDLTPVPAPTFTAVYNETSQSIDFVWPTDADARITNWKIFTKLPADADYTELVTVDSSGSESIPIDTLFPAGQKTTREFVMVAYAPFDIFSANSQTVEIILNRVPPSGVINFRINLIQ